MELNKYKGFQYTTYPTENGSFLTDAFDNGGSVVYGFGFNEESSIDDLKRRIDEYDEFFGVHID